MPAARHFITAERRQIPAAKKLTIATDDKSDSGLFRSLTGRPDLLWESAAPPCGRTQGPVAQIPQITSVDPGRP
jgi:hypothetical protein